MTKSPVTFQAKSYLDNEKSTTNYTSTHFPVSNDIKIRAKHYNMVKVPIKMAQNTPNR